MFRRKILVIGVCLIVLGGAACSHLKFTSSECTSDDCNTVHCGKDPSLEAIAHDLDSLERHIDFNGSITTKHPDIWGSARLTKYQQEVEAIFAAEANKDNVTLQVTSFQGARSRSDQAFLTNAVALNLALTGQQAALIPPDPVTITTGTRTLVNNTNATGTNTNQNNSTSAGSATSSASANQSAGSSQTQASQNNQATTTANQSAGSNQSVTNTQGNQNTQTATTAVPQAVAVPTTAVIPSDITTLNSSTITRNNATLAGMPGFGANGLRLEPTVVLDEKKRFLDHLNEIRRVNEGDDTADSPGYALYLVRVPVSVLPGKMTDRGHGAEITMSLKPVLGDELLPTTFRTLVINDMVDQYSELLVSLLNSNQDELLKYTGACAACPEIVDPKNVRPNTNAVKSDDPKELPQPNKLKAKSTRSELMETKVPQAIQDIFARSKPKAISPRPSRHAEFAYPLDHFDELFGNLYVKALILGACDRYKTELEKKQIVHLHDVRSHVREQLVASYRLLSQAHPDIWDICTPELVLAVRDLKTDNSQAIRTVAEIRKEYDNRLGRNAAEKIEGPRLFIEALGWGIMLESALLTDQLVRDIKQTTSNKGVSPIAVHWLDFYRPEPSPEARQVFNSYVATRWPMYTFAVDPVHEQQNIEDSLSQRRELQLALSLAMASGNMSASSFTRFSRRLEADYQTVDLNRTVVGFSHGDNTFGWRFYPRFQTPRIPSNLQVLTRDLLGGAAFNTEQELRERRLEPGQRECVALVIMPSFVPYAELNVSSSWFALANPKHKNHSTHETIKLSKLVRAVELCTPDQKHIERYRPGEFSRLQAKAEMLASRLPMQDMKFQVPYENTLGGFEFFNNGITDLVPQLRGWYGADGYRDAELTLFLMGDNFSINNTKVIVGGKNIPYGKPDAPNATVNATTGSFELLSRQVLRVTIPAGVASVADPEGRYSRGGKYVDVRLGTPYGVGGPLRIPVIAKPDPKTPELAVLTDQQVVFLDRDTDLILTGKNFTADLKAFAAGRACVVEVLGSTTAKVTVPKGVTPKTSLTDKKEKEKEYVDVTVATAAGVSNMIMVPVHEKKEEPKKEEPKAKALPTFSTPTLMIGFRYKNIGIEGVAEPNHRPTLRVKFDSKEMKPSNPIKVTFVEVGNADAKYVIEADYDGDENATVDISAALMAKVLERNATRFGPSNINPVQKVALTATAGWKERMNLKVADQLTIQWIEVAAAKKN